GTGGGGLEEPPPGAPLAEDRVHDRAPGHRHPEQVAPGLLGALLDGEGHLLGLAVAQPDPARGVADHDQRREREGPPALGPLGPAVDVDDPGLPQLRVPAGPRVRGLLSLVAAHQNSSPPSRAASATAATRPW